MLQDKKKRKVTIVGAGAVGSTYAYALAQSGFADEIVLTDLNGDLAKGQAMDLVQGVPYMPPVEIHAGSDEDFADSDLVVVTAGIVRDLNTVESSRHTNIMRVVEVD